MENGHFARGFVSKGCKSWSFQPPWHYCFETEIPKWNAFCATTFLRTYTPNKREAHIVYRKGNELSLKEWENFPLKNHSWTLILFGIYFYLFFLAKDIWHYFFIAGKTCLHATQEVDKESVQKTPPPCFNKSGLKLSFLKLHFASQCFNEILSVDDWLFRKVESFAKWQAIQRFNYVGIFVSNMYFRYFSQKNVRNKVWVFSFIISHEPNVIAFA